MKSIIIYGSRYGSARRYAQELSKQTGIPAVGLIRIYRKIGRISGTPCKNRFPPSYMAEQRFSICGAPLIIRRYLWDTEP